jgi:hypothetical protein
MENCEYRIMVSAEAAASASHYAVALRDLLSETDGVFRATRENVDADTMDLSSVVVAVVSSGEATAVARGSASCVQMRQGATLTVEQDSGSGRINTEAKDISIPSPLSESPKSSGLKGL